MRLEPGSHAGRFVVDGVIGAGGTATVYRVHHERLNTVHALKILELTSDTIRERLLTEGQAQATLNHPNIVAVTDILDLDGQPGLLMEYIDGPSLEDALVEYPFTLDDLEALFLGIVDGVEAAHGLGFVHRDLKLANILLEPTPQGFVPKITDFGLAKVLSNRIAASATQTGVAMGTPGFMAPEQVRDAGKVDERADFFSLGCVLYEMVSGKRTFPGDEVLQIYIAVTKVDFIPIREHVPDLPDRFEAAIRGCLQKDPDERIPDAATLRAVLAGQIGWDKGPVALTDPHPVVPSPVARDSSDRVLPIVLVGGSLALLGAVLLFAVLSIGIPLLLAPTEVPEEPQLVRAIPALPPPRHVPTLPEPGLTDFETPTRTIVRPPAPPRPSAARPTSPRQEPTAPDPAPAAPNPTPVAPSPVPAGPPATVKLLSVPPSADIYVDGEAANRRTPSKLTVPQGSHRVELRLRNHPPLGFDLWAGPGQPPAWCVIFATGERIQGNCP